MPSKRSSWFAASSQQAVSAKIATFSAISRSGPVQVLNESTRPTLKSAKYFVVGKSKVGGKEVVGG